VKRLPVADLTGQTCGTFVVGKRRDVRRSDGTFEWSVECTACGTKRTWSARELSKFQASGLRCTCQSKPAKASPARIERDRAIDEKDVDDLSEDELEAATLAEFERDRSLPRLERARDERRSPDSLLDDPSDHEDQDEDAELESEAGDDDEEES